ncbi:hypothetical protein NDI37_21915 [Funiculus sociatus GB2-A5]|uniref:Uncharacterized protein n=1 Tax=Funiculus sociatus GB2-A5 TaxID=2933946 RepID=A0ABV0JWR1_9CYAN|nr:hypothetical protein [Trichocoleus sp. FACHB-6]MBD2060753.1 hypothetical protein [Trichocoleus sp. FACHB-6]
MRLHQWELDNALVEEILKLSAITVSSSGELRKRDNLLLVLGVKVDDRGK